MNLRVIVHRSTVRTGPRWSLLGGLVLCTGLLAVSLGLFLLFGPYGMERSLILQLGLVCGLGLLLVLFRYPHVGIALVLAGGIIVKWEIGTGTQSDFNGALLLSPLLVAIWLLHLVFQSQHKRFFSPVFIAAYLFLAAACLAFLVGQYPWFPAPPAPMRAQVGQLAVFILSVGLFLVAAYFLQDRRWLKRISYIFIGLGSMHLVAWLASAWLPGLSLLLPAAVVGGSMFWTWLVALSCGQAVMNRDMGLIARLAMVAVVVAAVGIGLSQRDWLSGWVPGLISVAVILFLRFPAPVLMATPLMIVLAVLGANNATELVASGDNLYSLETRAAALESLLPILSANPVLGLGPANYYHYSYLSPIEGWYVKFNSHNNYLDLIAQTGLVGLACFLWLFWGTIKTAWRMQARLWTGFERGYAAAVFAGLVATLFVAALGDWVVPFVYNTGFSGFRTSIIPWIFMGGLIALDRHPMQRS